MKTAISRCSAALFLLAGLSLAFSAHAGSTWVFGGSGSNDANGEPLAATSYTGTDANLTISGAYATNGSNNTAFSSTTKWSTTAPDADPLYFDPNGLGMCSDPTKANTSCSAPNHALDNNGNTEAILMSFSKSIALTSIGIGYVSGDSDISLFRYTGSGAPPAMSAVGASLANMTAAGWSLVGNYGDLATDTSNPYNLVNASNLSSSYWLVTAYNASYGAATTGTVNEGDDYFKIYAVAGCGTSSGGSCSTTSKAPEPGSLALASLALFGAIYTRRQVKRKS